MKKRGAEKDVVRFLTVNLQTMLVHSHIAKTYQLQNIIAFDLERKRIHIPGQRKYTYTTLGLGWDDCEDWQNFCFLLVDNRSINWVFLDGDNVDTRFKQCRKHNSDKSLDTRSVIIDFGDLLQYHKDSWEKI